METNVDHTSMWSLVSNASILVQLVMLILVAASVTSWIMIFQRGNAIRAARRALDVFEERFWSGIDLSKLYRQAGSNPDPDSGVEQIFRAGFKEFSRLRDAEHGAALAARGQALLGRIAALDAPTVAAIDGFALGGGLELALACDYRVAADSYERTLGLPEVQLGIHPGFGGSVRVVELLGPPLALDLMLTGRSLSPHEALKAGLVDRVTLYVAPLLLGGRAAPAVVGGAGRDLKSAVRLGPMTVRHVGADLVIEAAIDREAR